MTRQELLTHRIDKTLKLSAQAKAKSENRSLSSYIRNLIYEDVNNINLKYIEAHAEALHKIQTNTYF